MAEYVRWFEEIGKSDVPVAGGKGANLGEMLQAGLPVPPGFVIAAAAYHAFIDHAKLRDEIAGEIDVLDIDDRQALERLSERIQGQIMTASVPEAIQNEVVGAYRQLCLREQAPALLVAVRSSATMEDSEAASFAGMNSTFLNVSGEKAVLRQVQGVWASLYTPRGVYYRKRLQLGQEPEIAVVVQKMVNSAKSGVAFSMNPATGDEQEIVIEGAFGLGETVVQGEVEPDHYEVLKDGLRLLKVHVGHKTVMLTRNEEGENVRVNLPEERADARVLTDDEVHAVAELVLRDEGHYESVQDTEWAIDDGHVYLVQSRPVTTRKMSGKSAKPANGSDGGEPEGRELVRGLAASPGIVAGPVRVLASAAGGDALQPGEVLVAPMTTPDWVPLMRRAVAIVTDSGGMTSHAAIVSRELGIPCVVATRNATTLLHDGMLVTVNGAEGSVIAGAHVPQQPTPPASGQMPGLASTATAAILAASRLVTATKLMVNLGEPEKAAQVAAMPVDGVGLLRAEFMLLSAFKGVHPERLIQEGRSEEFVAEMAEQLQRFAQAFYPRPVLYRSTDFRTNEFRGLVGGEQYEPEEANPMIGFRGAYRYVRDPSLFNLELQVIKRVREHTPNLNLMIPFVRTGSEMTACLRLIDAVGLREDPDFELWIMAEVPSVVYWLEEYARLGVHGVSIGSNDLTQLVLGVDRDSAVMAPLFDERDRAVLGTIRLIITECHRLGLQSSICGQAPSVHPDYAETLIRYGIGSISVNPDVVERTRYVIAAAEQRILLEQYRERHAEDGKQSESGSYGFADGILAHRSSDHLTY
ncbi:MAG: phosphoenolpyruvate synthase [Ktedonobacterales bacterium]